MKVWNITCECGHDADYRTLTAARMDAKNHLTCNVDKKVYIDQVETEGTAGGSSDHLTGKSVVITAPNPSAVALGSIKSDKKAQTSRENGKKGGRPIKMDDATFAALDRIIRYVSDLPGHPMADDCFTVSDWMDRR